MIVKTNVKLNLGLSVLRKRPDGFHDIETLFVPCFDFGDTLEIVKGDDYSRTSASLFARYGEPEVIPTQTPAENPAAAADLQSGLDAEKQGDLSGEAGEKDEYVPQLVQGISEDGKLMITIARAEGVDWNPLKDLCAKAYYALAQDFDLPPVKIFLEKTAPVGAGLGGGSADAAFTLKALNELCGLDIPEQRLSEYAASLGSDCAFFVHNRPMIGSGRGEVLEPYDVDLSDYEIKVLVPEGVAVSTAEAYKGIVPREAAAGNTAGNDCGTASPEVSGTVCGYESLKEILAKPAEQWKDLLVNDFETTVFKNHPELAAIKQSLYDSGAVYASMSGSGSALFAIYKK
jgi:4-diphosphocytidyl-2-C-methyl-D-erythritol kinase